MKQHNAARKKQLATEDLSDIEFSIQNVSPPANDKQGKNMKGFEQKLRWPLIAGHMIEMFDNTIYGFFAVVLAPIFFPSISYSAGILASYGAFAAGFLARPVGAILFGLIGDKHGRRQPLLWSMMCVGVPTIGIGIIPSFETLGILAPIFLIACRLAQGLFYGGEFTGINLYNTENFSTKTLGARTGLLIGLGGLGAVFATLLGAFVSMQDMPNWAWRVPFIFGGLSAFVVYLFRRKISETSDFMKAKLENKLLIFPWKELYHNHKISMLAACLLSGLAIMPVYFATIFGNRLFKEIGFSASQSMLLNMGTMTFDVFLIILCGRLADKIGFHRQILLGLWYLILVTFPAFYLISIATPSTLDVFLFIGLLSCACFINSCMMPYIAGFFPTNCRYSGVAMSTTLGGALLGGTAPLIGSFLTDVTGSRIAPAFWLFAISLATLSSLYMRRITAKEGKISS